MLQTLLIRKIGCGNYLVLWLSTNAKTCYEYSFENSYLPKLPIAKRYLLDELV